MFSEIHFEREQDGSIQGVLNNFAVNKDGTRKYLWGEYLFDITVEGTTIAGHTGDPRGLVFDFSISRATDKGHAGKWRFYQSDLDRKATTPYFNCANPQALLK